MNMSIKSPRKVQTEQMFSGLCLKADARRLLVHALESGNVFFHQTPKLALECPLLGLGADCIAKSLNRSLLSEAATGDIR